MNSPLLVMLGETASGKSELAIRIAELFNGELICADSWTVRKGLDIGTAKPSVEDRSKIPHHLLDVVMPDEDFTAAEFKKLANKAIADISIRGRLPIIVGGTGLYIDSVIYDYSFLEAGDRQDREKYNDMSLKDLISLCESLNLDIGGIDSSNKRRVIRLIETNGEVPKKNSLRENTLLIGVRYGADSLSERIIKRVDSMLSLGLEDEARTIINQYGEDCEAMRGVGYKQWIEYFKGHQNYEETRAQIISATQNLAKKQRTWFKRNNSIQWLDQPVNIDKVVELVTTQLSN